MTGADAARGRLVLAFEAWDTAEFAAETLAPFFPNVRLQRLADALHDELYIAACFCGFDPTGFHAAVPVTEWAAVHAALTRRFFPNDVAEATAASKEA